MERDGEGGGNDMGGRELGCREGTRGGKKGGGDMGEKGEGEEKV